MSTLTPLLSTLRATGDPSEGATGPGGRPVTFNPASSARRRLTDALFDVDPGQPTTEATLDTGSPPRMRGLGLNGLISPARPMGSLDFDDAPLAGDAGEAFVVVSRPPSACKENLAPALGGVQEDEEMELASPHKIRPPPAPVVVRPGLGAFSGAAVPPRPVLARAMSEGGLRLSCFTRPAAAPGAAAEGSASPRVPPMEMSDSPSLGKRKVKEPRPGPEPESPVGPATRRRFISSSAGVPTALSLPKPSLSGFMRAPSAPPLDFGADAGADAEVDDLGSLGPLSCRGFGPGSFAPPPPALRRRAMSAAGQLEVDGDLPVHEHALPTVASSKTPDCNVLEPETVERLLAGEFDDRLDSYVIVDCRYDYEYDHGHIRGAVSVQDPKDLEDRLLREPLANSTRVAIIFHCEFSSHRAPKMLRHLRALDRELHVQTYPQLFYPEIYLINGGYKRCFEEVPVVCEPRAYMPMLHERFTENCRDATAALRLSWRRQKESKALRRSAPL